MEQLYFNEARLEEKEFSLQFQNIIIEYISLLYSNALISKKENRCSDCCAYLGIAENLIKFFLEKTKNHKFLLKFIY